jgi:hypothetical protein
LKAKTLILFLVLAARAQVNYVGSNNTAYVAFERPLAGNFERRNHALLVEGSRGKRKGNKL